MLATGNGKGQQGQKARSGGETTGPKRGGERANLVRGNCVLKLLDFFVLLLELRVMDIHHS